MSSFKGLARPVTDTVGSQSPVVQLLRLKSVWPRSIR